MMKITFLGTSGSLPTKERNPSAVMINREGELLLFDCGEGTQQQMMRAKTGMMRLTSIFLSHLHADHTLGVPGLLQTMAFQGRTEELTIFGPAGLSKFFEACRGLGLFALKYPIRIRELCPGDIVRRDGYTVKAVRTDHSVPSIGYILQDDPSPGRFNKERALELGVPEGRLFAKLHRGEQVTLSDGRLIDPYKDGIVGEERRGLKIGYSGDTRESEFFFTEAEGADLLIHEATFTKDTSENAAEWGHSTAGGVGKMAAGYHIGMLALVHISQRFSEDITPVIDEAKSEFENVVVPSDLDELEITNPR